MKLTLWPQRLASQFVVLLLLALLVGQLITGVVLFQQHNDVVGAINRRDVGERIFAAMRLLQQSEPQHHTKVLEAVSSKEISFWLSEQPDVEPVPDAEQDFLFTRHLKRVLAPWGIDTVFVLTKPVQAPHDTHQHYPRHIKEKVVIRPDGTVSHTVRQYHHKRGPQPGWLSATIQLPNGQWLNVVGDVTRRPPLIPVENWLSMGLMALLLIVVVLFMVSRITRPLRQLQQAAERLGKGEAVEPLTLSGPHDIQQTSHAFNLMNARLQRYVSDRTTMLAALSHDLRTPITTLRLRAELMDDEVLQAAFLKTLNEMQAMTEATLAFVREEASGEPTQHVDIVALVETVCDDLIDIGKPVQFQEREPYFYHCRPVAIKRCVMNLVENAVKYGEKATVSIEWHEQALSIFVMDHGPGIPEDKIESLFKPFVRLDESRNQQTGGVGLGLAITRSIARNHGGDVTLINREEGGILATLSLPL